MTEYFMYISLKNLNSKTALHFKDIKKLKTNNSLTFDGLKVYN